MNTELFIKSINDINDNEYKNINALLDNKITNKHKLTAFYLLNEYFKKYKLNYKLKDIKYTLNGKPYLDNNLKFSISNKNDLVVVAISNHDIGVDIEEIKDYDKNILKYFYTKEEKKQVTNLEEFYKIYTLKESYIKMKDLKITDIKLDKYKKYFSKTIRYQNYIISYVINIKLLTLIKI